MTAFVDGEDELEALEEDNSTIKKRSAFVILYGRRQKELVDDIIGPQFNSYVGSTYEDLARSALVRMAKKEALPFKPERIGSWWSRKEEIDIVAFNEKTRDMLFGEVKWADLEEGEVRRISRDLIRKSALVDWHSKDRKEHYMVVGRHLQTSSTEIIPMTINDVLEA